MVVPTGEPDSAIVVLQAYGGGMTDYRTAQKIITGEENGRTVIADFEAYDMVQSWMLENMATQTAELPKSELFRLYYTTGLPWPDFTDRSTGEQVNL